MLPPSVKHMIRIADLFVDWQPDRIDFVKDFVTESDGEAVVKVSFHDSTVECHGVQCIAGKAEKLLRTAAGDILTANADWSIADSYFLPKSNCEYALPLAALCSGFSYFDTLLFHASFVDYKGEGIIFTGPSGVGKTTQAQLWEKYLDAEIVNGDKVFVRNIGDSTFAYGSPWKGSSEYCLDRKSVLKAIVILRQAQNNRVRRLDATAAESLMPHAFLPYWDEKCMENAIAAFDKLICRVPVLLLECKPDEEAVRLTFEAVFG